MEWVETTGRTVAEALEAALDQLGVDEQDAEVVVVEEPKSALFGLRKSEARVRARVRPTRPRPKRQRDRRRTRPGHEGSHGKGSAPAAERGARADSVGTVLVGSDGASASAGADSDGSSGSSSGAGGGRRRRSRSKRPAGDGSRSAVLADGGGERAGGTKGVRRGNTTSANGEDPMSLEEQAQMAQAFVGGVVERLGLPAATNVAVVDEIVEVSVDGDGLGLLIGPHGATLRALQELTRTAVQRHSSEHGTRIVVDVAGYRAKRTAALVQFAQSVARQVIETGLPHSLEPMSASDRKVVHDTINEIDGVRTASEGEESARHVVIYPSDEAAQAAPASPHDEAVTSSDDVADSEDAEAEVEDEADGEPEESVG